MAELLTWGKGMYSLMFSSRRPSILSSKDGSVSRFNCSSAEAMLKPVGMVAELTSANHESLITLGHSQSGLGGE